MLSYQHEYHAGNHADILKHVCLCQILESLCKKEKPFTVIDTHGGAGIFDLSDERLLKTGEAKEGIQYLNSLCFSSCPEAIGLYMQKELPYLQNGLYAGTPELERLFARKDDHIHIVEKHPQSIAKLRENMNMPLHVAQGLSKCPATPTVHTTSRSVSCSSSITISRVLLCQSGWKKASRPSISLTNSDINKNANIKQRWCVKD